MCSDTIDRYLAAMAVSDLGEALRLRREMSDEDRRILARMQVVTSETDRRAPPALTFLMPRVR